jgi:rod shape-determining protein MreC
MAVLDIRQRTGWLFLAVTVGHIILISAQVTTKRGVPVLEAVTFGAFAEVQRAATSAVGGVREGWENYFALQQIRRDNEGLRAEVAQLRVGLQQERALAQESRSLQQLLELKSSLELQSTAAAVIGSAADPSFRSITIDKGLQDGLRQDMAVISPEGVVGRVIAPAGRASKVQLLIDRSAAAGVLVERSRVQGVATGVGSDRLEFGIQLEYIPGTSDIKVGDRVVTSGTDGIYPKGFLIGEIESIERASSTTFSDVRIRPSVNYSALETVLVVLNVPPAVAVEESTASESPSTGSGSSRASTDEDR